MHIAWTVVVHAWDIAWDFTRGKADTNLHLVQCMQSYACGVGPLQIARPSMLCGMLVVACDGTLLVVFKAHVKRGQTIARAYLWSRFTTTYRRHRSMPKGRKAACERTRMGSNRHFKSCRPSIRLTIVDKRFTGIALLVQRWAASNVGATLSATARCQSVGSFPFRKHGHRSSCTAIGVCGEADVDAAEFVRPFLHLEHDSRIQHVR